MSRPDARSQRIAAGIFLAVTAPLGVAIAVSGGLVALAPILLLVVPVLLTGRATGVEVLERVRERLSRLPRAPRGRGCRPAHPAPPLRLAGAVTAGPLPGRGPPLPA